MKLLVWTGVAAIMFAILLLWFGSVATHSNFRNFSQQVGSPL